ncbi:hypothetical protein ACWEHA_35920 [Amycolatopsis nivea]
MPHAVQTKENSHAVLGEDESRGEPIRRMGIDAFGKIGIHC